MRHHLITIFSIVLCLAGNAQPYPNSYFGLLSRNDQLGTAKVNLKISPSGRLYIPGDKRVLRVTWPDGDSISLSYQVPEPGVYTISVKDKTRYLDSNYVGKFVRGLPTSYQTVDMIRLNCTPHLDNYIIDSTVIFRNGEADYCTHTYTNYRECYGVTCDTLHEVITTPQWFGFWSGMTDKLLITYQKEPIFVKGRIVSKLNKIVMVYRWRVTHL